MIELAGKHIKILIITWSHISRKKEQRLSMLSREMKTNPKTNWTSREENAWILKIVLFGWDEEEVWILKI